MATPSTPARAVQPRPADQPRTDQPRTEQPRRWNVVILDDQDHTYDYVIEMVRAIFGVSPERAYEIARTIDTQGRAVCLTTHREHAELKQEQIHAYGKDARIASCAGSMSALVEPAGEG